MSVVVERRGFSLPLGVSPETEIFAVGDIHGRSDLLVALIDEAAREPKLRDKRAIVFLGDFVDRGSDSLGAIELAMGAKARVGTTVESGKLVLQPFVAASVWHEFGPNVTANAASCPGINPALNQSCAFLGGVAETIAAASSTSTTARSIGRSDSESE